MTPEEIVRALRNEASDMGSTEDPVVEVMRLAATLIEDLQADIRDQGCRGCVDLGHHIRCSEHIHSIGELLGGY